MTAVLRVWWPLRRGEREESRVPEVLALVAFAVATAAALVCIAGLLAFQARSEAAPGSEGAAYYVTLATVACAVMVVPVVTLGGVAARLSASRRDQRLAALRLAGATSGQVVVMTLAESMVQALLGAVLGVAGYAALLPVLARLQFQGRPFTVGQLWVGPGIALAVVVAVAALAVGSGLVGLARVVIGPLGVTERVSPPRLRFWRVLAVLVALGGWVVVSGIRHDLAVAVLATILVGVVATANLVGPYVVMLFGFVTARLARKAPTLLAARRLVDDPRSTWRAVGAIGLGVMVAGFSTVIAGHDPGDGPGDWTYLREDLATGAYLTLGIVAVVAATSTGVVQAARVLDQRAQYRALALAGADDRVLHAARYREVTIPLVATVAVSSVMTFGLLAPFANALGPGLIVRFAVAIVAAVLLMVAAVAASRGLVRSACRLS